MSISSVRSLYPIDLVVQYNLEVIRNRCERLTQSGEMDRFITSRPLEDPFFYINSVRTPRRVIELLFWFDTRGLLSVHARKGESCRQVIVCFDSTPYKPLMEIFYRATSHGCRVFPGLMQEDLDKVTERVDEVINQMTLRVVKHFVRCAPCQYITT